VVCETKSHEAEAVTASLAELMRFPEQVTDALDLKHDYFKIDGDAHILSAAKM